MVDIVETPDIDVQDQEQVVDDITPVVELDVKTVLEDERKRREQLEKDLESSRRESAGRLSSLENLLAGVVSSSRQPAPQHVEPVDFNQDPERAVEQRVTERLNERDKVYGAVMVNMLEDSYNTQYEALQIKDPEGFKVVKDKVDAHFKSNPNERLRPGALKQVYTYFIGEHYLNAPAETRRHRMPGGPGPSPKPVAPTPKPVSDAEPQWENDKQRRWALSFGIKDPKELKELEESDDKLGFGRA